MDGSLAKLAEAKEHILANWPSATDVKKEAFANRISDFVTSPTIPLSQWLMQVTLKLTKDKMGEFRKDSERRYRTFMEHACTSRGASIGHALVTAMVKDKTIMYQQVDNTEAMLSRVTIGEGHASRPRPLGT